MADLDRDPIDLHLDMVAAAMVEQARHLDALVAEVRRLRAIEAAAVLAVGEGSGCTRQGWTSGRSCTVAHPADKAKWCGACRLYVAVNALEADRG